MCVLKIIKVVKENTNTRKTNKQKTNDKMSFRPVYAEDISHVYMVNKIFESVFYLFVN